MSKKKREYVVFKSVRLPICPHRDSRSGRDAWRFAYPDDSAKGGWRYGTRTTKGEARQAAHDKAVEIATGVIDLSNLSKADARLAADFLALNPTLEDVARLREWKKYGKLALADAIELYEVELGDGLSRHQKDVLSNLRNLEAGAGALVSEVTKEDLAEWIKGRDVGPKRRNSLRAFVAQFWSWLNREGYIEAPNGLTVADRLPVAKEAASGAIRYLSPAEMKFLLENVVPSYLPWLVLGAFSAIRSEEIHPRNYSDKPPLDWSAVKRGQGVIDLPAVNSKVKKRRLIPITPTLESWLKFIDPPKSGRIVPGPPTARETKRLGALMDAKFKRVEGWPKNVLRHSFLTYAAAIRKDLPAIAIEGGTSVAKLRSNYVEVATETAAKRFFATVSSDAFRMFRSKP